MRTRKLVVFFRVSHEDYKIVVLTTSYKFLNNQKCYKGSIFVPLNGTYDLDTTVPNSLSSNGTVPSHQYDALVWTLNCDIADSVGTKSWMLIIKVPGKEGNFDDKTGNAWTYTQDEPYMKDLVQ